MIFTAPAFLPILPSPLPLQETVGDFCLAANLAKTGRPDSADKQPPFVEAAIDRTWTADEIDARVTQASVALCLSWKLIPGQQWHKTVAILASNSVGLLKFHQLDGYLNGFQVDVLILSWAIHRIGGGCLMLQPTSSADEIAEHLGRVPPFALFVSQDLLSLGQQAVRKSSLAPGLPFYTLAVPDHAGRTAAVDPDQDLFSISTFDDLIALSKGLPPMHRTLLSANDATRRVAYYCTTSGTSGTQVTAQNPHTHTRLIKPFLPLRSAL